MSFDVATPERMRALGAELAELLKRGDLLVLTGDLGAGKTLMTQGIGAGLGVSGPVLSPTFVIARVHADGRIPLVHVDAYRLSGIAEIDDLDLDASLADSVTVVEWGEGLVEELADARLAVHIARAIDSEVRTVTLTPHGSSWTERATALESLSGPTSVIDGT